MLSPLKHGPVFQTIFVFGLRRYHSKEIKSNPVRSFHSISYLRMGTLSLQEKKRTTFVVCKCHYLVTGLFIGKREVPLGLILYLSNIFHLQICGVHMDRYVEHECVCACECVCTHVCMCTYIWRPEVGIRRFSLLLETRSLN